MRRMAWVGGGFAAGTLWPRAISGKAGFWVVVFMLTAATSGPARGEEMTVAKIRERYLQTVKSFDSVWMEYEQHSTFEEKEGISGTTATMTAAFDGAKHLLKVQAKNLPSAKRPNPMRAEPIWFGSDGKIAWGAAHRLNDAGEFEILHVTTRPVSANDSAGLLGPASDLTPLPFLGLNFNYYHHTFGSENLNSLLAMDRARLRGLEPVGEAGTECWHVEWAGIQGPGDEYAVHLDAWFDPAADFLPRRIAYSDPETRENERLVETFLEVTTPAGMIHFPGTSHVSHRYRRKEVGKMTCVVTSARINQPIALKEFKPPQGSRIDISDPEKHQAAALEAVKAREAWEPRSELQSSRGTPAVKRGVFPQRRWRPISISLTVLVVLALGIGFAILKKLAR